MCACVCACVRVNNVNEAFSTLLLPGGSVDPFTGGTSAPPPAAAPSPATAMKHIPQRGYLVFDNVPPAEALGKKTRDFSSALQAEGAAAALAAEQAAPGGALDILLQKLGALVKGSSQLTAADKELINKMLTWPQDKLFPALDLLRCAILEPTAAAAVAAAAGTLDGAAPGSLGTVLAAASSEAAPAAAQQTGLRLACNCFKHEQLRAWVLQQRGALLDSYAGCYNTSNKGVRLSMATFLLNLAVAYRLEGLLARDAEGKMQVSPGCWDRCVVCQHSAPPVC
jgi:phospholipase A-2-activating protein